MTSQDIVERLFAATAHGDEEHREWLHEAYTAFFSGSPVPAMRGKGRKEAEIEALTKRVGELEGALTEARTAIIEAAQDTLWCSDKWPAETVVDHIDAVLNTVREEEK